MRVTTKGQVTIPLEFRQRFDITPGAEVVFFVDENGRLCIKKKASPKSTTRFADLRGVATVGLSTDEIMALTRREDE